jgi:Fic family protein
MSPNAKYPSGVAPFPPNKTFDNNNIINLLIKARAELGELKGYSLSISNLSLFSAASFIQSLASSETEGINTTIANVLQNQLLPKGEQRKPDREVLHYRDAGIAGFYDLAKHPISIQTIFYIQSILLPGGPKDFRTKTAQTMFTPPAAFEIPTLIKNLEEYINKQDINVDPLIKSILVHYQFEAIHPFSDGNGRLGRILMVLLLVQEKILFYPVLNISEYINKNKKEYFHKLLDVTLYKKWDEYVMFMLKGFYLEAKKTKDFLVKTAQLFTELEKKLKTDHQKIYSPKLTEILYSYPIISPVKLAHELGIHYTTASRYLYRLSKADILTERKIGKYHLFTNKELLKIINGGF